jgi:uncharacterized protein YbjT (DUF2867 family)
MGVGSFESKLDIDDHLAELGLPVTVLRPMAFMELMTDRAFFPVGRRLARVAEAGRLGLPRPMALVPRPRPDRRARLRPPERFIGQQLNLGAEVRSLEECRQIYTRVRGRRPRRLPMPVPLFGRLAPDTAALWRWARAARLDVDPR